MPINRYDTISTATYNPRSLEETLMVPMLRRKQHDEANAKLESQLMALDKVDPLDVHYNEAQKIKSGLLKTIDEQSSKLATEGFNVNTTGDLFKTNRNIQELYSPTGRLGQINAAKIAQNEAYKRFLSSDDAKSNSADVNLMNWKKHLAKYKGYDDENKIINIEDTGAVKYIDPNAFVDQLATHAGFTDSSWKNSNSGLVDTGIPGENRYVVDVSKAGSSGTNIKNLTSLAKLLNSTLSDTSSPLRKSIDYTGRNVNDVARQLNDQLGIYTKSSQSSETSKNISNVDWSDQTDGDEDLGYSSIMDPSSAREVGPDIKDLNFSNIGTNFPNTGGIGSTVTMGTSGSYVPAKSKKRTYKDVISDPIQQGLYEFSAKRLIEKGKLPKNANLNDPKNAAKIGFYMQNYLKVPTVANDIIQPNIKTLDSPLMGELQGKKQNEVSDALKLQIEAGLRTARNKATGEKVEIPVGGRLEYVGFDSPINARGSRQGNKNEQSVMAHRAIIYDKDGTKVADVEIDRTGNEMKQPLFKKAYEANHVYKNALLNFGKWVTPTGNYSKSKEVGKYQIKFAEDGNIYMKMKGESDSEAEPMSPKVYYQYMNAIMKDVQ